MIMFPTLYCIDWPSLLLSRFSSPVKLLVSSTPIEGSIDLAEPTMAAKKLSDANSTSEIFL